MVRLKLKNQCAWTDLFDGGEQILSLVKPDVDVRRPKSLQTYRFN